MAASAKKAWWAAARWLRRDLALAPRGRRRLPGAGGKDGGAVEVEGKDGEDSRCSLAVVLLPLVEKVRVAVAPASSKSSYSFRSFRNSAFIFTPDI